ncbi:YceD family protein [Pseudodonghicola flavimaris]|uniref:DUF177 domain-containing protein n=1 Tax=Pseudodonghicola flavimaris TaxID=3050036 RepID=A0ABT7EVL2_9RHOB|nr:DUF177 domain-containing protein [Pseudodonghicola flavimaris]MDK3016353.1 DUF177 domain-containing protein [Pseudodonghicola flavimaris]
MTQSHALRVADLPQNAATAFDLTPDEDARRALAEELGISAVRKLHFSGRVAAQGKRDWKLVGKLGATVVQPCVVTLEPVTTRIDSEVERRFVADLPDPDGAEVEMPEDDNTELLGATIDPWTVMTEALALALPLYPRKEGAELGEAVYTAPGQVPMRDEDTRPFAGLAGLRDALKGEE